MNNNCNLTTFETAKMTNWKPVDQVREYGNQTDFVETSEFPDEPIKHFVDNEKECAEVTERCCVRMKTIIDFIKSWFYYPTLCKWFIDNNYGNFKDSRFQYAIKHCRMKKKIEEAKKHNYPSDWVCQYNQEPITSRNEE